MSRSTRRDYECSWPAERWKRNGNFPESHIHLYTTMVGWTLFILGHDKFGFVVFGPKSTVKITHSSDWLRLFHLYVLLDDSHPKMYMLLFNDGQNHYITTNTQTNAHRKEMENKIKMRRIKFVPPKIQLSTIAIPPPGNHHAMALCWYKILQIVSRHAHFDLCAYILYIF